MGDRQTKHKGLLPIVAVRTHRKQGAVVMTTDNISELLLYVRTEIGLLSKLRHFLSDSIREDGSWNSYPGIWSPVFLVFPTIRSCLPHRYGKDKYMNTRITEL